MGELFEWLAKEEREPILHPLLRIAVSNVVFLAIHPFRGGNGRLSRVLSNLLLLRGGYSFVSCSSLESVIEHNKEAYCLALRRTQTTLGKDQADWEPWILFFLRSMRTQVERLREKLGARVRGLIVRSLLAERLAALIRVSGTLSVADSVMETGANRNTLKDKFRELVKVGVAELDGIGRGSHYRPLR